MNDIYLDNSATTRVDDQAARAALFAMTERYGNPSSLHSGGVAAEQLLMGARRAVAAALGARQEEITFTSGGTEANNLALLGAMQRGKRLGGKIVTTAMEHSSVLDACSELERLGCRVAFVHPDFSGHISPAAFLDAVDEDTVLASAMLVNNEVGSILPIREMMRGVKRKSPGCLCHCDAVQAFGKLPIRVEDLGVDLLAVSGHKIHAPKGVGALYIRRGISVAPRQFGGSQERRQRPGTEPVPLIAALGKAVELLNPAHAARHGGELREHLLFGVARLPEVLVNSPEDGLPGVVNLSVLGVRSETLIHFLEERGIFVSSGSACARGQKSHVLAAMGLPDARIDGALRISFSKYNTPEDIDALLTALADGIARLRR